MRSFRTGPHLFLASAFRLSQASFLFEPWPTTSNDCSFRKSITQLPGAGIRASKSGGSYWSSTLSMWSGPIISIFKSTSIGGISENIVTFLPIWSILCCELSVRWRMWKSRLTLCLTGYTYLTIL